MKLLIIEDEKPAREKMIRLANEFDAAVEIIGEAGTVREAVSLLQSGVQPDAILMDIQLSDGVAFEIFERCAVNAPVIFTTAFDAYLTEAFAYNGINYLLKPIKREQLHQALEKFLRLQAHFVGNLQNQDSTHHQTQSQTYNNNLHAILRELGFIPVVQPTAAATQHLQQYNQHSNQHYKERIIAQKGLEFVSVQTHSIAFFYTENRIVFVVGMSGERYFTDKHLSDFEGELDPAQFFRLNRKYMANIAAIQKFKPEAKGKIIVDLSPKPDEIVLVSQERAAAFKAWMER